MSRLMGSEPTVDQIHDWFKIGKKIQLDTVPRSKCGIYPLDPKTGEAAIVQYQPYVPSYRRPKREAPTAYADHYRDVEEESLKNQRGGCGLNVAGIGRGMRPMDDGMSSITLGLERVHDTLSVTTDHTGVTSVLLPEGQTEEEAVQVYKNYNFTHEYDGNLPITQYRQDIIDMVECEQVTVIQGETGSGKTTQVPQFILDHYAAQNRYCNIVVTQPRRIAAISIAERVCAERNWRVQGICGYQVGLERRISEDTRLTYCTTGVLLQKLIAAKNMNQYTHIFLDEVHERDEDSDFCILVVRKLLRSVSREVKVILMSATIDSELFARYFARPIAGILEKAPVLEIKGRSYEVSEYYLEDLEELCTPPMIMPYPIPQTPEITQDAYKLATKLIIQLDELEKQSGPGQSRGSVLVFLPGLGEIGDMESHLHPYKVGFQNKINLVIYPLHSSITSEEQARVFLKPQTGHRKVILSTNIAESSITVTDVKYVIDFCLTKTNICDPETNYTSLQLQWASKANCNQRKGRAGRVSNGRVYRLVTNAFWRESIDDYGIPEMQRCSLEQLVLKVKLLDLGEPKAILGLALAPPKLDDIERTILDLKEVGALASLTSGVVNPHDGDLTFLGRVLGTLPLDVRMGKLILLGHVFGLLDETIIISACQSLKSFFARPFKATLDAYNHKLSWASGSLSDCISYLNAYTTWVINREGRQFHSDADEMTWGKKNFIQIRRIKEVEELVKDLKARVRKFNICTPEGPAYQKPDMRLPENLLILKIVLCGAFYPNYFVQQPCDEQMADREIAGHNPLMTVIVKGLPANQGALYRKQLENNFSRCDPTRKPKMHFEETRAYIEFMRDHSAESNKVPHSVFLALKLRQLGPKLKLTVTPIDSDLVRQQLEQVALQKDSHALSNNTLRSNRVEAEDEAHNGHGILSPRQVALPPANVTIVQLFRSHVSDCGHFWAYYSDETTRVSLLSQHAEIQQQIAFLQSKPLPKCSFTVGDYCLAPFIDQYNLEYYRGRVENIKDGNHVQIFFLDYGNMSLVNMRDLLPIDNKFLTLPFQAFECVLAKIKPSAIKCPNGQWSPEAKKCFERMLDNADNLFGIIFSIVHGFIRLELMATINGQQVNINDELFNLHYADRNEESFSSMQNHQQREIASIKPHRAALLTPEAVAAPSLHEACHGSDAQYSSYYGDMARRGRQITLTGPWSPYEVEFVNCTYIGKLRPTRIERDSVNSVAVDAEPHCTTTRMMVAASVNLNPNCTMITARDTTLLPNIPGLLALVSLLFAPIAELRTDRAKKKYIGALCGLGWDNDSSEMDSAFPDHDMEIPFDTEFDVDDLKMINGVRIAINLAIGNEEPAAGWGTDGVVKIQKSAREKLFTYVSGQNTTSSISFVAFNSSEKN